jgi:SOS-response transcriptional repressor LexA
MAGTPPSPRLTQPQREIALALLHFINVNGFSPTVRELGEATRRSPGTIHQHLETLRANGIVDWWDGQPRTIHFLLPRHEVEALL